MGAPFVALVFLLAAGTSRAEAPDALKSAAIHWVAMLKSGETQRLATTSRLPFVVSGFRECTTKKVTNLGDLTILLSCMVHERLFIESLPTEADATSSLAHWQRLKLGDVDRGARKTAKQLLAAGYTLVGGVLDGNGISYNVAVAVGTDGAVGGLLIGLAPSDDAG